MPRWDDGDEDDNGDNEKSECMMTSVELRAQPRAKCKPGKMAGPAEQSAAANEERGSVLSCLEWRNRTAETEAVPVQYSTVQ